jgi:hypothetical protein
MEVKQRVDVRPQQESVFDRIRFWSLVRSYVRSIEYRFNTAARDYASSSIGTENAITEAALALARSDVG